MPREDLLALDTETLVVLANRGLVKRAVAEIEAGSLTYTIEEANGDVTMRWSDDVECRLPASKPLTDGRCSCPATTLCRHLLRTVLAYQQLHRSASTAASPPTESEAAAAVAAAGAPVTNANEPWDPGAISDDVLTRVVRPAELARARRWFAEGQVIDLVRSRKPTAVFHTQPANVRFLMREDLRYVHCDCAETVPCAHAALAVLAFRLLPEGVVAGSVSTRTEPLPCPTALLDDLEAALIQLARWGIAGAPQAWTDRMTRLESRCRQEGLIWPAEILADLAGQRHAYREHDARFSPQQVVEWLGELLLRLDAIRRDTGAIPALFVRGSGADRVTDSGAARFIGLGCEVRQHRGSVTVSAYLQDARTGALVTLRHSFADPSPESTEAPRDFPLLGQWVAAKGASLAALGSGQLQVLGGKRDPGGRFTLGRAQASFAPQAYQWEALRPPVLVDDFQELAARLATQPPTFLAPRRVGANLAVVRIGSVVQVEFSPADQSVRALLQDTAGTPAWLQHPFTHRGREGAEALLARLRATPEALRFVSAHVHSASGELRLSPLALIFEEAGVRSMLQPWVDRFQPAAPTPSPLPATLEHHISRDPLDEVRSVVTEQWLLGCEQSDPRQEAAWRTAADHLDALGFHRIAGPARHIAAQWERRRSNLRWDAAPTAHSLLLLTAWLRLAQEIAPSE